MATNYFGPLVIHTEQACDVARCHRVERIRPSGLREQTALVPSHMTIGIALAAARLPTIYPQPHDTPLDLILTEDGIAAKRTNT